MSDVACISVRGLTRRFGALTAVDGLTFDVGRGELFGIVGPDGAGKTTTLRMLAGVLPPTAGDAEVLGISVGREPERVKPRIGYMSQRFGLYEDLTVRENLAFYADLYGVPRAERPARLERLYRFSNLGEFQDRLAGALSGGMKQKLSLSCALIHHPEVLLLDEPTFGVDPISRRDLWLILHGMVAGGMTVVLTTSYLDEAERCDRVALLDHGRVLALGTPAELANELSGRLFSIRTAEPRRSRDLLRSSGTVHRAALFGEVIRVIVAEGRDPDEARRALMDAGHGPEEMIAVGPTLEDVFLSRVPESGNGTAVEDRPGPPPGDTVGPRTWTEAVPTRSAGADEVPDGSVRVRALSRAFGDFVAVDRVTFSVAEGEIFGFLGPNGAGKTTTIKMLTGLLQPTSGGGTVAGLDIVADAPEIRRKIGYMSQKFSLYADLTVEENIELFAGLYGVTGRRLDERRDWVLAMAGLEGRERRLTADLPLGWKQRLALGCAVLHEPPILFLDEPTSGVDPVARRAFWDLIDALAAAGTTVLVSTHYMEEAEHCHRLILMNRGRLIAEGTPAELRASLTAPIYELEVDPAPRAVELLRGAPGIGEATLFGRNVHVTLEGDDDAETVIAEPLALHGLAVASIRRIAPSLEDVFVSLVRQEGGAVEG